MAIIRGPITYRDNLENYPFDQISIGFSFSRFQYLRDGNTVRRKKLRPSTETVSHALDVSSYQALYSGDYIVGEDPEAFINWAQSASRNLFSVDEFKLEIPYSILNPKKVKLDEGHFSAYFFFDTISSLNIPNVGERITANAGTHGSDIDRRFANRVYVVNVKAFHSLLRERSLRIDTDRMSEATCLMGLISEVGQFSEDNVERTELTEQDIKRIIDEWRRRGVDINRRALDLVSDHFEDLTSFPIELEPLLEIEPAGSFHIVTSQGSYPRSDLAFYKISAEAQIRTRTEGTQYHSWDVDWNGIESEDPIEEPLQFQLDATRPIYASSVEGSILVRVRGFEGATLWNRAYQPDSEELKNIEIVIDAYLPGRISEGQSTESTTLRRIRGQVISADKSQPVSKLTVVLQAKETENALWRVISAGETGASGYFSIMYPKGGYVAAQALVSLAPNSAVDVKIVDSGIEDETISDDFIYILIDTSNMSDENTCLSGNTSRLPDHTDLIGSNEYSQDLGGQCVNVTTPNRTLREYSYNAIVRFSDPDVARYTLEKNPDGFKLSGGSQTIERAHINLSNPVRWQDAPEATNNLSFYQSVEVATGHILFYKAVFKADGYSLGDLVYSLPLAPGQKKQIVSYDMANKLEASEEQRITQGERLTAELLDDRIITDELGGGISETLSGQSSAKTSGLSAGIGIGVSAGKFGGSLGVAGGYSNARSSASQSGSRNISQFFAEKLRQALMQNAESYRELNASVVTTVKEGQEYAVATEVVANHNHCHAVTMMFFEVLRHYAIFQELVDVQECVFVPLLLTEFTQENISKWKDVLAENLLPIPSNTYLQPAWFAKYVRRHPLEKAFDANERIKTDYTRVDYPENTYAEDQITSISGEIRLRTRLPRPRTQYDRIMSLPIISRTITHKEVDVKATMYAMLPFNGLRGTQYSTTEEVIQERARIFDQFMTLDDNFQTVPPAQAIRVHTFAPQPVEVDGTSTEVPFFQNRNDEEQWQAYANILGFTEAYELLEEYFAGNLISEWDRIFNQQIAPLVFKKIVDSIKIAAPLGEDAPNLEDLTPMSRYTGGEQSIRLRITGSYSGTRMDLSKSTMNLHSNSESVRQLHSFATLIVENVRIQYTTAHFNGYIYNGYVGNDLLDGTDLLTPLTNRDKRNPHKEDEYLVEELFQHLNSNLEHYNKVLWRNLDPDRRYMLIDGFGIEVFDRSGTPQGDRSLASVVKNDLITIVGNALVFPVADGYHVSRTHITADGDDSQTDLLEHYRPSKEVEPYRLSVPTRGVYMESVMGKCDACEDVKDESSQDWSRFGTEEPTAISPVVTPTPTRADWRAIWAQFAQPLISIQTPREAPAPGAGLQGLSEALSNAEAFRDVTGLAGNQENVIRTYLSNQENARAFAEMAKTMAMQEHNSENSRSIIRSLDNARESGAISDDDYRELVRDHLGQQIDGGARRQAEDRLESSREPSLTNAAIDAVEAGRDVRAQRTLQNGAAEAVHIGPAETESTIEPIFYDVPLIPQPNKTSCWAAAMAMIESYRRSIEEPWNLPLTAEGLAEEADFSLDQSYGWDRLEAVKEHFGFEDIALRGVGYPTAEKWRTWLQEYGPLYVTIQGTPSHAIVVRGISGDVTSTGSRVDILNPLDTDEIFDDHPTDFDPPNRGSHQTMSVDELNEAFSSGSLRHLSVYDNWRVLYHPALEPSSISVPPTGSDDENDITTFEIKVQNRYCREDNVINCRVSIIGAVYSWDGIISDGDFYTISTAIPLGRHALTVASLDSPLQVHEEPPNWPDLAPTDPDAQRIWLGESATIEVDRRTDGRGIERVQIVSVSGNPNFILSGNRITVNLRPLWAQTDNKDPRTDGDPGFIIIHHTTNTRDLPPHFIGLENRNAASHYVITRGENPQPSPPGKIIKFGHEEEALRHTSGSRSAWNGIDPGQFNNVSIGIEIVHRSGNYLDEQYTSLLELLSQLQARYPAIVANHIIGHMDVALHDPYPNGELGNRILDPGRTFDWPRLEAAGYGIRPASPAETFAHEAAEDIYEAFYSADITREVTASAPSEVIRQIKNDLSTIGYHIPSNNSTDPDTRDAYDPGTQRAILVFKSRFFSGSRQRNDEAFYDDTRTTTVDFETAQMIKRVLYTIENS